MCLFFFNHSTGLETDFHVFNKYSTYNILLNKSSKNTFLIFAYFVWFQLKRSIRRPYDADKETTIVELYIANDHSQVRVLPLQNNSIVMTHLLM